MRGPFRVALQTRLIAKAIDLALIVLLAIILYPVGILLGVIYLSVADSLQNGQSVGKKLMGMAVISLEDGRPCSVRQSLVRNLPIIVPLGIMIFPFWGIILGFFMAIPFMAFELYLLFHLDSGHRMGDVMADTTVMANTDGERIKSSGVQKSWFKQTDQMISQRENL